MAIESDAVARGQDVGRDEIVIQDKDMNETAGMLEARLALIERIRRVEHALAHAEQARVAMALLKGRSHDLGNSVQIVKLSAQEIARRLADRPDVAELVTDMAGAADHATGLLQEMMLSARPLGRSIAGPVVSHGVRAAIEAARPALLAPIELRIELDDTVHSYCAADELEALVLAAALDAATATHLTFVLRERLVQGKRWVELLRVDDRQQFGDGELAHMFEESSLLRVVAGCAKEAQGAVSLSPIRGGIELAIELPVAPPFQSSSSS